MLQALNSHFLLLDAQARPTFQGWKGQIFSKSNLGERRFEWLLMTPVVICNNCNFTKQYWSNILSNEFLGGDIWMLQVILSHAKCQWNVCYNKLKQVNFQKTDVGGETQDICQELAVTSGHTKSFFSEIFGRFLRTWR